MKLYILPLWLLFVLIFLLTVDIPISFAPDTKFIGIIPLMLRNWLAIISLFMALAGVVITFNLKHRFGGVHYPPAEITSIILIEEYCMKHPKTKKAAVLRELLEMSYSMDTFPDDAYALEFDRIMAREKDLELYDALTDLDGFLFG